MSKTTEIPHHHAKAVIQGHRHHQPVLLSEVHGRRHKVAIVEDIVMAQRGTLGKPRGATGVLNVDRLIHVQAGLS